MQAHILTPNNGSEFEYEFDNKIYKFSIDEDKEKENEENGDKFIEYQIFLTYSSNNRNYVYIKRFPENKKARDSFFKILKPTEIDFEEWERY